MQPFTQMGQALTGWQAVGAVFYVVLFVAFLTWAVVTWDSASFWRAAMGGAPAGTFRQRMRGHLDWSLRRRDDAMVCLDREGVDQAGRYALFCIESLGGLGAAW